MQYGFERDGDDPCLLYMKDITLGLILKIMLFVDDLAFLGNWEAQLIKVLDYMREFFDEVKVEDMSKYVGMQIERVLDKREVHVRLKDFANESVDELVPKHVEGSTTTLFAFVDYRALSPGEEKPIWDVALHGRLHLARAQGRCVPASFSWSNTLQGAPSWCYEDPAVRKGAQGHTRAGARGRRADRDVQDD
jgi:hypothetical protein